MPVFKVQKNTNYTVMSNYHFRDMSISLKAKGLLSQMLSLPSEWNFTLAGLAAINKEGIDAIREGVKELERAGYLSRKRIKNERGVFVDMEYTVYEFPCFNDDGQPLENPTLENPTLENPISENPTLENPISENPTLENPTLENPTLENPLLENPTQLNKDILSKDILNKDIYKSSSENDNSIAEDDDDKVLKEKLDYASVMRLFGEHKKLVELIYRQIKIRGYPSDEVNEEMFLDICGRVIQYADTISNKTSYINKCIDNILAQQTNSKNRKKYKYSGGQKQDYDIEEIERTILAN